MIKKESVDDVDLDIEEDDSILSENEDLNMDDIGDEIDKEMNNVATEDSDEDLDDIDDEDVDLDDIDLSDLSDEELNEMEEELRDSDLDDVTDDVDPVELSADEEREADDLMSLAGTTELLRSELNDDERNAFLESSQETQIAVFEGFLLESDIVTESESDEDDIMTESRIPSRTRIQLGAEARKAQLYSVALNVCARAHGDEDFIKLQRVQKMRRVLKRKIQKKYHAEAVRRMKVYFNRLKSSKSSVLAAIGKKFDK